jgi:DNA-binding NtrC family response regulator
MDDDAGTALIVSRDEPVRHRCAEMLVAAGLGVRMATDREDALSMFAKGGIDVIVASAPEVDGPALLQEIRRHDEQLPVIFVTEWPDFSQAATLASGSSRGGRSPAESLRNAVVAAAVQHQVSRARRK